MAVMASDSPDVATDDRIMPHSVESDDASRNANGGVNGHTSSVKMVPVIETSKPAAATPNNAEQPKDAISLNKEAFASNRAVSAQDQDNKTSPPEQDSPDEKKDSTVDTKEDSASTTGKEDTAPAETTAETDGADSKAPEEPAEAAPAPLSPKPFPADAPASSESETVQPEPDAKPDAQPDAAPSSEKPDVEMEDAPAPAPAPAESPAKSPKPPTSSPAKEESEAPNPDPDEDSSLRPTTEAADNAIASTSIPAPTDVAMTDAPPSPSKVSREREEDADDQPAAKRVKTDGGGDGGGDGENVGGDTVEVSTAPADKMQAEARSEDDQVSLYRDNGEPKSLADSSLDGNQITPWQSRKLRAILAGIKKTKAGSNFKASVEQRWPAVWLDYQAKIAEPVDITLMEKRLKGTDPGIALYPTMGHFKRDLRLLYDNSVQFNGENHFVSADARSVRDQVFDKMANDTAVEVARVVEKKEPVKHHPSRHAAPRAVQTPPQPPARRPSKAAAGSATAPPTTTAAAAAAATTPTPTPTMTAATGTVTAASGSPVEKPAESPAFAIPPNNNGVPVIRRDSTKTADDRPKRPIHPPKNKDLSYEPKKKKKLPPELRFCDEVLTELKKAKYHDFNQHFMVPVDPIALNIPNYHKIVKKPMDLQTMTDKLYGGQYGSLKDFEKDFQLIVKNCIAFNGADHFISTFAAELENLFKREWAKKDDWLAKHAPATPTAPVAVSGAGSHHHHGRGSKDETDEEEAESEAEAEDDRPHSSATLEALQRRLDEEESKVKTYMKSKNPDMGMVEVSQSLVMTLQKQIIQERQKLATEEPASSKKAKAKGGKPKKAAAGKKAAGGAGAGAGAGGGASGTGATGKKGAGGVHPGAGGGGGKKGKRTVSAVDKEVIATAISNLEGDALSRAIEIIKRDTNENENDSGELELDIDVLSQDALVKLLDISNKAFPELRAEKERNRAPPPPAQAAAPAKPKAAGKPKKNKPMGKAEQERRLQQLNDLKAAIKSRGSNSQEPGDPADGNGGSASSPVDTALPVHDSEEESSEEE